MIYKEKKMNLFDTDNDYILVHCISNDFEMSMGVSVYFTHMGIKKYLIDNYYNDWNHHGYCIITDIGRKTCNLVTKEKFWKKPTYKTLKESLEDMKIQLSKLKIKPLKIAMPVIGCGLDKLNWNKVKEIIQDVFKYTDIEILVCIYE